MSTVKSRKKHRTLRRTVGVMLLAILAVIIASALIDRSIGILVLGLEHTRTDTMFYVKIDTKTDTIDIITLPRDTYYPVEGRNGLGQKKLNAVYGFTPTGGAQRVVQAAEDLLGTTIDHYLVVDYGGVRDIIDLMGGIEIDVPMRMKYNDPYAAPPLSIDLQPGLQRLDGKQALEYLRFRQSSDGSYSGGDIERIARQQDFIARMLKQAGIKLPYYALRGLRYVDTDLSVPDGLLTAAGMIGFSPERLRIHTLPEKYVGKGEDGLYYYFHDPQATQELMRRIAR